MININKQLTRGLLILAVGLTIGFVGGWFMYVGWPTHQAEKAAQAEKEKMEQMVRAGEVREIQREAITIEVERGGADVGETRKYRINEYSKVQIGMGFIDKPGEKTDLTQWFEEGDHVNLMVSDGQAVVIIGN